MPTERRFITVTQFIKDICLEKRTLSMKPLITAITKNAFLFLPITSTHSIHLCTTQSGQDQCKFLFLVPFSNSVFLMPEHLRRCQTLQQQQHLLSPLSTFFLHYLHVKGSIFLAIYASKAFTMIILHF